MPMAIYKHVANKDELLDGMVASLIGEIDPPAAGPGLEECRPLAGAFGEAGAAAASVGPPGHRIANQQDTRRPGIHGLVYGHVPGRRLLGRPHAPCHACHRGPHVGLHPGAVRRPGRSDGAVPGRDSAGGPGRHVRADGGPLSEHRRDRHLDEPRRRVRSSGTAATTSSSSNSPSTFSSTASSGCTSRDGHRRGRSRDAPRRPFWRGALARMRDFGGGYAHTPGGLR